MHTVQRLWLSGVCFANLGYGVEVDVWSLGVIMHIMLVGYAPFRSSDRDELFQLIQDGGFSFELPGWSKISQGLHLPPNCLISEY